MKTRIQKIIIMAVALLFASVGVSFADDLKASRHKPLGNAYGHYKKGYDFSPGWHITPHQPKYHYGDRYGYREVYKVQRHYDRHSPHEGTIIGFKVNEPVFRFVVVVKERR